MHIPGLSVWGDGAVCEGSLTEGSNSRAKRDEHKFLQNRIMRLQLGPLLELGGTTSAVVAMKLT